MAALSTSTSDRSAPRAALKSGDLSRDGRGRIRSMPPILHYGFRPFFFLAALHAGLAIPLWLWAFFSGVQFGGPFEGMQWHAHEMLFGYLSAVLAGFILTAIPNWTGRLPLSGLPLLALVGLWIAGRAACLFSPDPWLAMAVDLTFPAALSFAIWREVLAGRNWKNAPVAAMFTVLGLANAVDHLGNMGIGPYGLGQRLSLAVAATLLALIGGRIVPSFTRNWLVKEGSTRVPSPFGALDRAALAATVVAMLAWAGLPQTPAAGVALSLAGLLLAARLTRWCGMATLTQPILFVLHLGYGWLALALVLMGISQFVAFLPASAALHALTSGAVGSMTLAVMTRASLGHTRRAIIADRSVVAMYGLVSVGAGLRVVAPFAGDWYTTALALGGALWCCGFLLFAVRFAPILWGPRAGA
ncbi:NnrS family protein [Aurantimonas sp. DM33-3]|uniref:NnrS family protein n=1 Tax=Aurantimonas sp. DM33-3 TaxID=2766955 RepID=UPI0016520275|nr:NnrS family protein [Aurantimonas sp. DM33-3]MBC6718717.1 NnrS family protein [Aurantimonas sp. DM33-3]